jgi:hypothetical protein
MCGMCGDLTPREHWTDRAVESDGGGARRHRFARLAAVRALLVGSGLTVTEWQGRRWLLGNGRGQTAVVEDLGALWAEAERMLGLPVDPLAVRRQPPPQELR